MKLGAMLLDAVRSFFHKPATRLYPAESSTAPERLRGKLHWHPESCTGCCLCVKDCPSNAIELITLDKQAKRFVLRYHADRCTFCAQCVKNCRFGCIEMSNSEWELAASTTAPFTVFYGEEDDVNGLLARFAQEAGDG